MANEFGTTFACDLARIEQEQRVAVRIAGARASTSASIAWSLRLSGHETAATLVRAMADAHAAELFDETERLRRVGDALCAALRAAPPVDNLD